MFSHHTIQAIFSQRYVKLFTILFILTAVLSCKKDKEGSETEVDGDFKMRPVVMLHGLMASADTYELQAQRFYTNGYPMDMLYTFEYNSFENKNTIKHLNEYIDEVLAKTGADKVDLVGHSLGSSMVYSYCDHPDRANKIAHLVMLAGFKQSGPAGNRGQIPTLNIWSVADKVVTLGGMLKGATNVKLTDKDHYEVATCVETFESMYQFFMGGKPATTEIMDEPNPQISGKALSFGENIPTAGSIIEVYSVDSETGFRLNETPNHTFVVNDRNEWGPFTADKGVHYEFVIHTGVSGDRAIHYYREPFKCSNQFMVVRSYPPKGSMVSLLLGLIPSDDNQSVIVFFSSSKAALKGRDELRINEHDLSTNAFIAPSSTTIALFAFDHNENKRTDVIPSPIMQAVPFLQGADFYFEADPEQFSTVTFNNRALHVPHRPSGESISVAVFDY